MEELIRRYHCDIDGAPAVVRFVFELPGMRRMVVDLCAEQWSPIEATLRRAIDEGGARPVRDTTIRSMMLNTEEAFTGGGSVRPGRATKVIAGELVGAGRWVISSNRFHSGVRNNKQVQHWCPSVPADSRCGLAMMETLDFDATPGPNNPRCKKCVALLEFDGPAPPQRPAPAASVDSTPALFSDGSAAPAASVGTALAVRPHAAGQFTDLVKSLTFEQWPRHHSFAWVEYSFDPTRTVTTKAHAKRASTGGSVCSRLDAAKLADAPDANGNAPLCGLCLGGAIKIVRHFMEGK